MWIDSLFLCLRFMKGNEEMKKTPVTAFNLVQGTMAVIEDFLFGMRIQKDKKGREMLVQKPEQVFTEKMDDLIGKVRNTVSPDLKNSDLGVTDEKAKKSSAEVKQDMIAEALSVGERTLQNGEVQQNTGMGFGRRTGTINENMGQLLEWGRLVGEENAAKVFPPELPWETIKKWQSSWWSYRPTRH